MQLPEPVKRIIEERADAVGFPALAQASAELSDAYRAGRPARVAGAERLAAYLVTRMPATYAAAHAVLGEVRRIVREGAVASVLDIGAGTGAASLAARQWFPKARLTLIERDAAMAAAAREWLPDAVIVNGDVTRMEALPPHDLVMAAYSLGELACGPVAQGAPSGPASAAPGLIPVLLAGATVSGARDVPARERSTLIPARAPEIEMSLGPRGHPAGRSACATTAAPALVPALGPLPPRLWCAAKLALVAIEPGTPRGFTLIRELRGELLAAGAHMLAPCPGAIECPMVAADWCHFAARVERSSLHRRVKGGALGYEDEKYSYVALAREAVELPEARIIRHPQHRPGLVVLEVCTVQGLRQRPVAKRERERFRAARQAAWGDALSGIS